VCVGAMDGVEVIDAGGGVTTGCVLHGAVLLASLEEGRLRKGSEKGATIAAYRLAQELPPFAWHGDQARLRAVVLLAQHVRGLGAGDIAAYLRGLADGAAVERGEKSGYDEELFGNPAYQCGLSEARAGINDEQLSSQPAPERRRRVWGWLTDELGSSDDPHMLGPDDLFAVEFTGGWTAWAVPRPALDEAERAQQAARIADNVAAQGRWAIVRYQGQVLATAGTLPKKYAHLGRCCE